MANAAVDDLKAQWQKSGESNNHGVPLALMIREQSVKNNGKTWKTIRIIASRGKNAEDSWNKVFYFITKALRFFIGARGEGGEPGVQ